MFLRVCSKKRTTEVVLKGLQVTLTYSLMSGCSSVINRFSVVQSYMSVSIKQMMPVS